MDESGNSGVNLLDPAQPVFTLGSVALSDQDCARWTGNSHGEIHFTKTRRTASGRRLLLETVREVDRQHGSVIVIHKAFMVTAKIVDHLVENVLHSYGIDTIHDGSLVRLVNAWHFLFEHHYGPDFLPRLQQLFVQAARTGDRDSVNQFYELVDELIDRDRDRDPMPGVDILPESRRFMEQVVRSKFPVSTLEPGYPAAHGFMYEWARTFPNGLIIRHDDRHEARGWVQHMRPLFDPSKPTEAFRFPQGEVRLPLPVGGFEMVDSRNHPAVQVADVLASATAFVLRGRLSGKIEPFAEQLVDAGLLEFISPLSIWPDAGAILGSSLSPPAEPGVVDSFATWIR